MNKPHIINIMADQLRADALGAHTPNLNALIQDSTVFNRCYCASPLCVPARGAYFTGRWPNETGSIINPWEPLDAEHGNVKAGIPNLYGLLEEEWDSWHTGKQHLYTEEKIDKQDDSLTHWNTLEKGYGPMLEKAGVRAPGGPDYRGIMPEQAQNRFTRMVGYSIPTSGCYPHGFDNFFDGYITNTSLEAIRERDTSKPFMLNAMYLAPHPPLEIPEPWFSQIKEEDIHLPENVGRWGQDQSPLQLYNLTGLLGSRYSRDDWIEVWRVYLGLVALFDHGVGQLLDALKEQGVYDDSLIIFTADHGEMLGSHMLWQKMCAYDESARVPLSIKLPGGRGDRDTVNQVVSHVDILPTILECCDKAVPDGISGSSLLPVMNGETHARDCAYIQFDGNGTRGNFSRAIVKGDFKLNADCFKDEVFFELYNLKDDPLEMQNLAFEEQNTVQDLLEDLIKHMQTTGDQLSIQAEDYETFINGYAPFRDRTQVLATAINRL